MGRILLIGRLAARDLRRRPAEAALLLLAITAATTTLTLGLVLRDAASDPYQRTREATSGPDVVAGVFPHDEGQPADLAVLEELTDAPGVAGHGGPYPMTGAALDAAGQTWDVQAVGRDPEPASLDQPDLTEGRWVRDGGAVVEATFADALGVGAGDPITLNGRSFEVAGVAVTASTEPDNCLVPCYVGPPPDELPPSEAREITFCRDEGSASSSRPCVVQSPGLIWLTQADLRRLAPQEELLSYILHLRLDDPAAAQAFADARPPCPSDEPCSSPGPAVRSWQDVLAEVTQDAGDTQPALVTGSSLIALLAVAGIAVLVGGRMADQTRRVGLVKAVGGTPGLVAVVLLAEYLVLALIAATAGLTVGRLVAPLLIGPSVRLLGSAGVPPLTGSTIGVVAGVALGVVVVATTIPALRAARTSTVLALAGTARPPRRTAWLIAVSARLPVPLLVGLRTAARRPRRLALGVASIAVTVSGVVAVLAVHAHLDGGSDGEGFVGMAGRLEQVENDYMYQVVLAMMVVLLALSAVNAIVITWATALDARHAAALTQALGATPRQVSTGLSAAQMLPAAAGALLGIPAGLVLVVATGGSTSIPVWQLVAVVPGTAVVVGLLATVPARLGARRPTAEILSSELA